MTDQIHNSEYVFSFVYDNLHVLLENEKIKNAINGSSVVRKLIDCGETEYDAKAITLSAMFCSIYGIP